MFQVIDEIITDLKNISKTTEKVKYIASLGDEEKRAFSSYCHVVLDTTFLQYNVSESWLKKQDIPSSDEVELDFKETIDYFLAMGVTSGFNNNTEKEKLLGIFGSLPEKYHHIIHSIINRKMRCGVSVNTINKAVGEEVVFIPPYMRCDKLTERTFNKIGDTFMVQPKVDGLFVNMVIHPNDGIWFFTRQWKDITEKVIDRERHDDLIEAYNAVGIKHPVVIHGELIVMDDDRVLPREEGNGYINSDNPDKDRLHLVAWDCVPLDDFFNKKSEEPYKKRLQMLGHVFAQAKFFHSGMEVIKTIECSTIEEVKENFQEIVKTGGEGLVIKKIDGMWKHGTSREQLKVKVAVDCDLKIVEWKEGLGKYSGMVGSIRVQSSDGIIDTWVGSGLSDDIRKKTKIFDDAIESSKIVCVRYNDVVESENADRVGLKSLYLPRFIEIREDKTEADSFQRVVAQLEQIDLF